MVIRRYCLFLLDREKGKDDARLRFRIRWHTFSVAFSLGFRVDVLKWSQETERCINSTTHGRDKIAASVINKEIQRFSAVADSVFASFESSGVVPSESEFRDAFNLAIGRNGKVSVSDPGFFEIFDNFVSSQGSLNNWSVSTHKKFGTLRAHLFNFNSEIILNSVNDNVLALFVQHLQKVVVRDDLVGLRNTSIMKLISFVRWFLRWASNNGLYSGNSHVSFRPKMKGTDGNQKEVIHLSWDELMALMAWEAPPGKLYLDRVRDVFCFCCFTGLRFSDVLKLCRADVRDSFILVVTQKTTDALKIELNKYSRSILDKYSGVGFRGDRALPVISNQKMNDYLKELGREVGLVSPQRIVYFKESKRFEEVLPLHALLTSHCARRTFIVNALALGIDPVTIMSWTGHSDYKAMKPYIKIVDDSKVRAMDKFNR